MRLPTRNKEGIEALVRLLAPNTRPAITPHWPRKVVLSEPASLSSARPVSLSQGTPLGPVGHDANTQLLIRLFTNDLQEARAWLPQGQLHTDLSVLLRVYLGWRCMAKLELCLPVCSLPNPVLGRSALLLGMTGVLRQGGQAAATDAQALITINLGFYKGLSQNPTKREVQHVAYRF